MEDLGLRKETIKVVLQVLATQQKNYRVEACCALKEELQRDSKTFTVDEAWSYG